jgi:Flp pilus assembly protein TadG
MKRKLLSLRLRFTASTDGVAAIEFATILPILVVIFLGTFDAGRAIAVYLKVRATTFALASITNQYSTIQSSDMTTIIGVTTTVLAPYSSGPASLTITQIAIDNNKNATVSWSYSQGGTAYSQGATIAVPTKLDVANTYLIFAEVGYRFAPMFGYFSAGNISLSDNIYTVPRSNHCINYPPENVTTCT